MKTAAAAVWLVLLMRAGMAVAAEPDTQAFRREYRQVYDGLRSPLCHGFLDRAVVLTESPLFAAETSKGSRYGFLDALDRCAMHYARREVAFRSAELKTRLAPKEHWPQVVRLGYGVEFGHPESSLEAFEFFVKSDPAFLRGIPLAAVWNIMRAADQVDDSGTRKLAILEVLQRLRYAPPYGNDDLVRHAHARLLLARGRIDEARARLDGVTAVGAIALVRVDGLFAPLRSDPALAARLDFKVAIERDLARSREAMDEHPDWMLVVHWHAAGLKAAKRYDEALALVEAAIARDDADRRAYADGHRHRRLLDEMRALLLIETGRLEEAVQDLLRAANQQEYRRQNVSQMTMLALYLVDLGRGTQALPLLPKITGTTRGERAWVEAIRSCAGAQLGREEERTRALDYLKAHESDDPAALSRALICSDDVDGAAALMIRRLARQSTSASALLAMQLQPALHSDTLPYRRILLERFAVLRERADVQAAVRSVGAIERLPVDLDSTF